VKWYRLAADKGYAGAQYGLGLSYKNGQGVPQSDAEASRWYRLAADQGYALAQANLGLMYAQGQGVPQDLVRAYTWLSCRRRRATKVRKKIKTSLRGS